MPLTTIGMAGPAEAGLAFAWMFLVGILSLSNALAILSWTIRRPDVPTLLATLSLVLSGNICLLLIPDTFRALTATPPSDPELIDGDNVYWVGVFLRLTIYAIVSLIFSIVSCIRSLRTKPPAVPVKPIESV